jgi:hypothetical protein
MTPSQNPSVACDASNTAMLAFAQNRLGSFVQPLQMDSNTAQTDAVERRRRSTKFIWVSLISNWPPLWRQPKVRRTTRFVTPKIPHDNVTWIDPFVPIRKEVDASPESMSRLVGDFVRKADPSYSAATKSISDSKLTPFS